MQSNRRDNDAMYDDTDVSAYSTIDTFDVNDPHFDMMDVSNSIKPPSKGRFKLNLDDITDQKSPSKPSFGLNLDDSVMGNYEDSFRISNNGIFQKGNIEISRDGLKIEGGSGQLSARSTASEGYQGNALPNSARSLSSPSQNGSTIYNLSAKDLLDLGAIGQGVSGLVKKCFHRPTLSLVAVKCISIWDKAKRHQMIKELHAFEANRSQYIVSFLGAFFEEGTTKLALEFANRGSLQSIIEEYGALNEDVLVSIAAQSLLGLQTLHMSRTVHRDIKPANILVNSEGFVKISDFGIVAELQTSSNCDTFVGTAVYMSPERLNSQSYSYASDIWSLGMSLITAALGRFPFSTNSGGYWQLTSMICDAPPPTLDPDCFSDVCISFIALCLKKDPDERGTIQELLGHPFVKDAVQYFRAISNNRMSSFVSRAEEKFTTPKWPFPQIAGNTERKDLSHIIHFILEADMRSNRRYTRSLMDLARFNRIAEQLTIAPQEVQAIYEKELLRRQQ